MSDSGVEMSNGDDGTHGMENTKKVSFRLTDDQLGYIDAVRWNDDKKKYTCGRSAALRKILEGYEFSLKSSLNDLIEAARSDQPLEILKARVEAKERPSLPSSTTSTVQSPTE
ncbi:unnamed protein product [marine sediment metagenome]|uniref:Uncharacterized protein n=1 Tax=marine sediment metagenome TaxID=412755 RepID=X0TUE4_9ZZZZ